MITPRSSHGSWPAARLRSALMVLSTLLLLAASSCSDARRPLLDEPQSQPHANARKAFAATPANLAAAHRRAAQKGAGASHAFAPSAGGARMSNAERGMSAELDGEATVRVRATATSAPEAVLSLSAVGRPEAMRAAPAVTRGPAIEGARASYARGAGIEEWYENGPLGLEQGFVIAEPPSADRGTLALDVAVSGALRPAADARGRGDLALVDHAGKKAFGYSALSAIDAGGRALPSAMRAEGRAIRLSIDDRAARYPITIDPLVWVENDKLLPDAPGTASDQLGATLSLSGDTAILGAAGNDEKGIDAGAAYVFVKSGTTWVQQQKITAMDAQTGAHFGCSVAISGDVAVVGAYGDDQAGTDAGAAYVFVRSGATWTQAKKIVLAAPHDDDYFGYAVAISGDAAVVGAHGDDSKGSMAGAAYVFARDEGGAGNWGQVAALTAGDGAAQDNFGIAVAIDGDTALVGARGDDDNGSMSGSVYVFVKSGATWSEQQKLVASDGAALDYFGSSLSISGNSAAIGAHLANSNAADAGAAYVFVRSGTTWSEQQRLTVATGAVQDYFGSSVTISQNRLIVGAWGDDEKANDAGAAYVYTRTGTTWALSKKILASDGAGGDNFGWAAAIAGTTAIVAAPADDDQGANAGSVYVLDKDQGGADLWGEVVKVRALDGMVSEQLGSAIAVSGDTVIAGAFGANDLGTESGVAYVFRRSGTMWSEEAKLVAEGGAPSDRFGFSVAISGDTAVVGAYQRDGAGAVADTGAAHVFVRNGTTWTEQQKITPSDAAASDFFGVAVGISGDTIAVGAHGDDDKGSNSGSVYVFTRSGTTWTQQAKLVAADGAANDNFGRALAIDGNTVVVGSPNDDDGATNAGSAYVFLRTGTTWAQQQKLVASDPAASDAFGFSVAVSGNDAIIGAYLDDGTVTDLGAAYVFVRSGATWTLQQKLVATDGLLNDRLGYSVSIAGNLAVVGAYNDDDKAANAGAAYVFERTGTTWALQTQLYASDAAASDVFGYALAFDGTTLAVGAYGDDDKGSAAGAAYAFTLVKTDGTTCGMDTECQSGHCVDGVCCVIAACPACHSCGLTGSLGQCAPDAAAAGSACGDTAETDCSHADTCDTAGVCQPNHLAAATACGDATVTACSGADTCDGAGTCLANDAAAGTACNDATMDECTKPDTCNGSGVCADNHAPDGTPCKDSGKCASGVCEGAGGSGGAGTGGAGGEGGKGGASSSSSSSSSSSGEPKEESTAGCGCEVAGADKGTTLLPFVAMAFLAALLRRRDRKVPVTSEDDADRDIESRLPSSPPARRTLALRFLAAPLFGALLAGCGGTGDTTPTTGSGGTAGAGGTAGHGGTGGTGGSTECPDTKVCGFACCGTDQECVDGQCLAACPATQTRCGPNQSVCCGAGQECYNDTCVAPCPTPQVRCGDSGTCCATGDVCANAACVTPSGTCLESSDCKDDEYCEPTLGVCLSTATLPDCKYHPPVGDFSPIKEWTYSPITAPYVRLAPAQSTTELCGPGSFPLAFPDADDSVVVVALGSLTVPFFDANRSVMTVSTNGWLSLDPSYAGDSAPVNQKLPAAGAPDLIVAPYWDDLQNVTACARVDTTNHTAGVQWHGEVKGTGEWVTVQAILHGNGGADAGVVELGYVSLGQTQDGDGATIGIAEPRTRRAVLVGHDRNGSVSTGTRLGFRYVPLRNRFDALAPPAIFDLDGDGKPEVIFPPYDDDPVAYSTMPNDPIHGLHSGVLTILNGEDGTIQARPLETPGYDGYLGAGATLSIGDLDLDGKVEIVGVGRLDPMVDSAPYVKAFRADGSLLWVSDVPVNFNHNGWGGGVHLADLDHDGYPEIFFGLNVYNHEGVLQWQQPTEYASPATTAADLDGDGFLEVVSDHSAWRHDGTMLWSRPDLAAYHFPSIADFDLDGKPEVALVADGKVIILKGTDGSTFWGPISLETNGGGPLNIGDFDGDGYPELGTAGEGLYIVLDLQCTGTPLPAGCDREGVRWGVPTKDISSNVTGSSLFDFEGDGMAEVIYSDECFTRVFSGRDGLVLFETPVNTRTATEYPLVADIDGDNNAEILIVANESVPACHIAPWNLGMLGTPWVKADYPPPFCGTGVCGYRGLTVYGDALDNWVRTRRVWSGHAYHITNVASNGSIPQQEPPNWTDPEYNNFRMNAQGAGVFSAPDLKLTLTTDELPCPAKLRLRAKVQNTGALGVSAGVNVAFFKDGPGSPACLGVIATPKDLLPGGSVEVTLDYTVPTAELDKPLSFHAAADSDCAGVGANNECENGGEDNNEGTATGTCKDNGPK